MYSVSGYQSRWYVHTCTITTVLWSIKFHVGLYPEPAKCTEVLPGDQPYRYVIKRRFGCTQYFHLTDTWWMTQILWCVHTHKSQFTDCRIHAKQFEVNYLWDGWPVDFYSRASFDYFMTSQDGDPLNLYARTHSYNIYLWWRKQSTSPKRPSFTQFRRDVLSHEKASLRLVTAKTLHSSTRSSDIMLWELGERVGRWTAVLKLVRIQSRLQRKSHPVTAVGGEVSEPWPVRTITWNFMISQGSYVWLKGNHRRCSV